MSHHPSCRESDKSLIWFCNQCGEKESADEEQMLAEAQQPLVDALQEIRGLVTFRRIHQIVDTALAKVKEGK